MSYWKQVNEKPKSSFFASAARYTSVAMTLPGATLAGYLIGYGLDNWLHTTYLKIVFLILGIVSGFYDLVRGLLTDMHVRDTNAKDSGQPASAKPNLPFSK